MPRSKPQPQPQAPISQSQPHLTNYTSSHNPTHPLTILQQPPYAQPATVYPLDTSLAIHTQSSLRTNAQLNLSVLQRYYPSISSILTISPFVVLYTFSPSAQVWEKAEVDGTLFVCSLSSHYIRPTSDLDGTGDKKRGDNLEDDGENYAIVILNRRGLDNFYFELGGSKPNSEIGMGSVEVEVTDEFTILQMTSDDGVGGEVWGLWIYEEGAGKDGKQTRNGGRGITSGIIAECAERVRGLTGGAKNRDVNGHDGLHSGPEVVTKEQQATQLPSPPLEYTPIPPEQSDLESRSQKQSQIPQLTPHNPPKIPTESKPQPKTHPLPLFTPSADTQFFLSAGRGGRAQLSRHHPAAPAPATESKAGNATLEALFAKAGREFEGKL